MAMSTYQAVSQIQLTPMPQLAEAVDKEDDWTGITDAASRRKRQNRLNVRAYRRRKLLESKPNSIFVTPPQTHSQTTEPLIPCWVESQQLINPLPASIASSLPGPKGPLIPYSPHTSGSKPSSATAVQIIFPLSTDHLITLLQYNVLRASITNRLILSNGYPIAATDECTTAALSVLPFPQIPTSIPKSLLPTKLQQTVPHESWIDIVAHPVWRDNLIMAIGTFDEDALWADTIGGLFEGFPGDEVEKRGLLIWDTPWDIDGWEVSDGFWKRWGWSAVGFEEEVVRVTNKWRGVRGEQAVNWL